MFGHGKTATNGIAVMNYLAGMAPRRAGSEEISKARSISRTFTAKLLTQLSGAGLVTGQPGAASSSVAPRRNYIPSVEPWVETHGSNPRLPSQSRSATEKDQPTIHIMRGITPAICV
jgi:hypothetical protein